MNLMVLSKETSRRIFSAIVLLIILAVIFTLGDIAIAVSGFILTLLALDEILVNFLKLERWTSRYLWRIFEFLFFLALLCWFEEKLKISPYAIPLVGTIFNLSLFVLAFFNKFRAFLQLDRYQIFWSCYLATILYSFFKILFTNHQFIQLVLMQVIVVAIVDSSAWFFGKNFGKRKLWARISPNKTLEGGMAGIFFGTLSFVLLFRHFYLSSASSYNVNVVADSFIGITIAVLAIIGDLAQSAFKRSVLIKDSSAVIPGHGGIYDRLDSHYFVIPFYSLALQFLG